MKTFEKEDEAVRRLVESIGAGADDGGIVESYRRDAAGIDPARERMAVWAKIGRRRRRRAIPWAVAATSAAAALMLTLLAPRGRTPTEVPRGIAPGSAVAILELGDGRQVRLDTARSATIERQGVGASLSGDGAIVYAAQGEAPHAAGRNTLYVPRGGEYRIALRDGTVVWLNADSRLEYPLRFDGGERRVALSGEGYFEVAHDAARPFVVETRGQVLTVLGTRFNLSAYDGEATVTTLCEGGVRVAGRGGAEAVLAPDQQARLEGDGGEFTVAQVDAAEFTRWKDGVFVFDERGLGDVVTDIARWYDVRVAPVDARAREIAFKGNLPKYEELDTLLAMIERIAPVSFHMQGGTLHVILKE